MNINVIVTSGIYRIYFCSGYKISCVNLAVVEMDTLINKSPSPLACIVYYAPFLSHPLKGFHQAFFQKNVLGNKMADEVCH